MGVICDCFLRVSLSMFARKSTCTVSGDDGRVSTRMTSASEPFLGGTEGGRDMESGVPRSRPPPLLLLLLPWSMLLLLLASSCCCSSRACWWLRGLSIDLWTCGGKQTLTEVIERDVASLRLVALLCRSFLFRFAVWGALCLRLVPLPLAALLWLWLWRGRSDGLSVKRPRRVQKAQGER